MHFQLRYFLLRCRSTIIDFHKWTGPNATHPELFRVVWEYYGGSGPVFPIYLQHEGHSRTVIGIERTKRNNFTLLLLDPGIRRARVEELINSSPKAQASQLLSCLRKTEASMKHKQYQLVRVEGMMSGDDEYERAKQHFNLIRIP